MAAEGYDDKFMQYTAESSAYAAHFVATRLSPVLQVRSVMDVGCARGTWLRAWIKQGVTDVRGVDGAYVDSSQLEVPGRTCSWLTISANNSSWGGSSIWCSVLRLPNICPRTTSSSLVATLADHAERYVMFSRGSAAGQVVNTMSTSRATNFWRGAVQAAWIPAV